MQEKLKIAVSMRQKGLPLDSIAEITGLSIDEISSLR